MKTFQELDRGDCRYPIGEALLPGEKPGSGFLFCSAPTDQSRKHCPYCLFHAALAYDQKVERQPDAYQKRVPVMLVAVDETFEAAS
jgi:hypothetical protein